MSESFSKRSGSPIISCLILVKDDPTRLISVQCEKLNEEWDREICYIRTILILDDGRRGKKERYLNICRPGKELVIMSSIECKIIKLLFRRELLFEEAENLHNIFYRSK